MTASGQCPLRGLTGTPRDTHRSRVPIAGTPTYEAFSWDRRRALSDFLVFSNMMYAAIGYVYATKGRPGAAAIVTLSGLTSFVYHVSRETVALVADQVFASVAFLSSVALLPRVPTCIIAAEAALVTAAFVCKYLFQSERSVVRFGGAGYWAPHCIWHLLVAIGQALLVASLPDESYQAE